MRTQAVERTKDPGCLQCGEQPLERDECDEQACKDMLAVSRPPPLNGLLHEVVCQQREQHGRANRSKASGTRFKVELPLAEHKDRPVPQVQRVCRQHTGQVRRAWGGAR